MNKNVTILWMLSKVKKYFEMLNVVTVIDSIFSTFSYQFTDFF